MTEEQLEVQSQLSVAIVDDAYAPPDRECVQSALGDFCHAVEENDVEGRLFELVGNKFLDAATVGDDAVAKLFEHRNSLPDLSDDLLALFSDFTRRRADLAKIVEGIRQFKQGSLHEFASMSDLSGCKDNLDVVFLDYYLKNDNESTEVARQVYEKHRAFIILMSDRPDAAEHESQFRKQSRLLSGFFKYLPKTKLVESDVVYRALMFVPENPKVCHAIHDLIDALELALGGKIDEVEKGETKNPPAPGRAVGRFMNVVRTLPLQDYALLCELTLADEGHPLGDYVRRLLGSYLIKQVFTTNSVAQSLKDLDSLRFTEFLPLATTPSDSLKELYASSLVEPITNPWGEHPWENETVEDDVDAGAQ